MSWYDDIVMILSDSNFKLKKRFRLGIITGIKRARDKSTQLATVHVKIVDGLACRKTKPKPHNCEICGNGSFCNLSTSSRNCCLLEKANSNILSNELEKQFVEGASLITLPHLSQS